MAGSTAPPASGGCASGGITPTCPGTTTTAAPAGTSRTTAPLAPAGGAVRGAPRRHVPDDDRVGAHLRPGAHHDGAQHAGTRADDDAVPDRRMALGAVQAAAPERDVVVEHHVVADLGGLADDDAHAVVDEEPPADGRAGVDLDAG